MKNLITIFVLISCYMFVTGQVGINTFTPQAAFHVDGSGNTPATSPGAIQPDDFVVTSSGNVGIGTIAPTVKLETQSPGNSPAVKIVDGTQGDGKVLTSDANGNANWQRTTLYRVVGNLGSGVNITLATSTTTLAQTGSSITLPPGKWEVVVNMLMSVTRVATLTSDRWAWLRTSFADTGVGTVASTALSVDIVGGTLISGLFSGPLASPATQKFAMLTGSVIINNTSASSKTYYYVAGYVSNDGGTGFGTSSFSSFGGAAAGENSIVATPIQ